MAGPILLLFMIKPILARRARADRRVSLIRGNEPRLFAFVDAVCEAVGAVKPSRIDIDCNVNASASFRRGFLSLMGRDLVLTIGMPLVAGLSMRQFAGILAHEFGHFTQAVSMRLTFIIHAINGWFSRIAYERDAWDEKLEDWQENADNLFVLICLVSRLLVWISRLLLRALMYVARAVSCAMLRQMEYDADRYEARLVGAEQFENTSDRMVLLTAAHHIVMADLAEAWKDHRLGDDLPGLIAAKIDEMPDNLRHAVREEAEKEKTGMFSTHPSNQARKKHLRKENAAGVFHDKGPALALFTNFERACKGITLTFYQGALGANFRRDQLISTDALKKRRQSIARVEAAAARYFYECLTLLRPLEVDPYSHDGKMPPKERLRNLRNAREALSKSAPIMQKSYERLIDAEDLAMNAQTAQLLAKHGIKFDKEELRVPEPTEKGARKVLGQAQKTKQSTTTDIRKMEDVFRLRLECALALLSIEQVARRITPAETLLKRSRSLLSTLSLIHAVGSELTQLRNGMPELRVLTYLYSMDVEDESLLRGLIRGIDERNEMVLELRRMLQEHTYPFEHADGTITVARYAIPHMPSRQDVSLLRDVVIDCLDKMGTLYKRCMGELALIAEKVEAAVGMEPQKKASAQKQASAAGPSPGASSR